MKYFVNTSVVNSPNCGASSKPCCSISFAVNLAVRQNVSSLTVNISTGRKDEMESVNWIMQDGAYGKLFFGESGY